MKFRKKYGKKGTAERRDMFAVSDLMDRVVVVSGSNSVAP